jgi:hypothetical protein
MADEDLGFLGNLKSLLSESADLAGNIGRIQDGITTINRSFGESRARFLEFSTAVSDGVENSRNLARDSPKDLVVRLKS